MSALAAKSQYSLKDISAIDNIEVLEGERVLQLLSQDDFQLNWDSLYQNCPWSTVFQSRKFVTTWYRIYAGKFTPILVRSERNGRLTGLLTLALPHDRNGNVSRRFKGGCIVGAGSTQAEYQVWLTATFDGGTFIREALSKLLIQFKGCKIQLRYVPEKAPLEWASNHRFWKKRCFIRQVRQPLIILNDERINKELHKKNRREKVNRLKRLGDLKFERVRDRQVFQEIFDELALQYEFRKEAMYNTSVFKTDALRKEFLLALFDQNLLHTTILTLNGEIIASNVGASEDKWVHLQGINTHSPTFAKYSPGILHFLMLSKMLWEEGKEVFDLTPGADTYKDLLATNYISAYHVEAGSQAGVILQRAKQQLADTLKQLGLKVGVQINNFNDLKSKGRFFKAKLAKSLSEGWGVFSRLRWGNKSKNFSLRKRGIASSQIIRQCSLSDLLAYDQSGSSRTRWEFLEEAMHRLEQGDRSYTWSEQGHLLACAWLRAPVRPGTGETCPPDKESPLEGLYCHRSATGRFHEFLDNVASMVTCRENSMSVPQENSDTLSYLQRR